jgi:hypothetical protein
MGTHRYAADYFHVTKAFMQVYDRQRGVLG